MSSDLLNNLEIISDELHNQSKFIENIKKWIYQFEKYLNEISFEDLNKIKDNLNNLLINNSNINEELNNLIKQAIELIEDNKLLIDSNEYNIRLLPLNSFYPYLNSPKKTLNISNDKINLLFTNEKHLLIIGKSKIYLFNENLKILKEKYLFYQGIKDICWSKSLEKFLLISSKELYTLNDKQMIIKPYKLYFNINETWKCITCSDNYLFLSCDGEYPFIIQFNLFPSIQFYKKYYLNKYSIINDIKYNSNNLAIIIEDNLNNQSYFQYYSLNYFQLIIKINLGNGWNYRSTLFNNQYWIISDYYNQRFIHISIDGFILKIEKYFSKPEYINYWNNKQILIKTNQSIHLHQSQ